MLFFLNQSPKPNSLPEQPAVTATGPEYYATRLARWQDGVREPCLGILLLGQLLLLFVMAPLSSAYPFFYDVVNGTQLLLLAISYFVLPRGSKTRLLIVVCFVPMFWVLVAGSNQYIGLALRMFVTLSITVAVAQMVFRAKRVSRHQLFGAVVVYLNLALLFMGSYVILDKSLPAAFTTSNQVPLHAGELLYFSLTTLTSTGYGDIVPVHPLTRSLANLEAVAGQLFLAVLLGRLVSMSRRPTPE